MNRTGCPDSFATDMTFEIPPMNSMNEPPCSVNLVFYWTMSTIICLTRIMTASSKIQRTGFACCKRFRFGTITLVTSIVSSITYCTGIFLVGFNVANASNGGAVALVSFCYFLFTIDYSTALYRMVRLGGKIIPVRNLNMDATGKVKELSKFNGLLVILFVSETLLSLVACITLLILNPIFPQMSLELRMIGFSIFSVFHFLTTMSISYQHHRCVKLLRIFLLENTSNWASTTGANSNDQISSSQFSPNRQRIESAIRTLRVREYLIIVGGNLCLGVLLALAIKPSSWNWELVYLGLALPESSVNFMFEFIHRIKLAQTLKKNRAMAVFSRNNKLADNKNELVINTRYKEDRECEDEVVNPEALFSIDNSSVRSNVNTLKSRIKGKKKRNIFQVVLSVISEESGLSKSSVGTQYNVATFSSSSKAGG